MHKGKSDREGTMVTEAEIEVIWPQVKECPQPLQARRDKGQSLPQSLRKELALPAP